MEPNIDIIKDFSALQVTVRELSQANLDLIKQLSDLREENKELQKTIIRLKSQQDWFS